MKFQGKTVRPSTQRRLLGVAVAAALLSGGLTRFGETAGASGPASPAESIAGDWPQWRGPNRDERSAETGLLKKWPKIMKPLWTVTALGQGYSTVAASDGKLYTTGMVDKRGLLFCLNLEGKELWRSDYGPEWTGANPGSRTTPTVHEKRIYLMSGNGLVVCLGLDGKKVWDVDTVKKFGSRHVGWGLAESLLIDGNNVICTPGGTGDATLVALDKADGTTVWKSRGLGEKPAYCSPIAIQRGRRRLIVTVVEKSIVGLDATDGKLLWKSPNRNESPGGGLVPNSPVYCDGIVYCTSSYGAGSLALQLNDDGSAVQELWRVKKTQVTHGGVVLVGGCVYSNWFCQDLKDGTIKYDMHSGQGAVTYADGMLFCYSQGGWVNLIRANPDKFELISSLTVEAGSGEHWAHPVVCGGRLYIRHGDVLMAYNVKGERS